MGLGLGMTLKFYHSVAKVLKLKVRMFLGLIPTFVEVTRGKLVEGLFCLSQIIFLPQIKIIFGESFLKGRATETLSLGKNINNQFLKKLTESDFVNMLMRIHWATITEIKL